ncbi:glycosyltransferase [Oscillatoria amoena NRMC-F 0135]|nr:glycosyltransferase [Oscillatoria amoena NRMC-F 0135]
MVLGFHYHIPAYQKNGKIYTMSLQGLFIDSLAPHWHKVVLFMYTPLQAEFELLDYEIQSDNVDLVELIDHSSVPKRLLQANKVAKIFKQHAQGVDIFLLRAPTPLLPFIVNAVKKSSKVSYLIVGYMLDFLHQYKKLTLRNIALKTYFKWNEGKQAALAKDALVFANSTVMYEMYKPLSKKALPIKTTTLKQTDFFYREDTCQNAPYEILYAGRIDESKGVIEITEALGRLNKEGIHCKFNLVGWSERNDNTQEKIKDAAAKWGITDQVIFHGKKKVGDELFGFYRRADIYVMASTAEGFPRTIWEALASSVPVIAAPVGAIPHYLKDGHDALFVRTRNTDDVYDKIKLLISDGELRRQLIQNGSETVQEVTLEIQSQKMCDAMKSFLNEK